MIMVINKEMRLQY